MALNTPKRVRTLASFASSPPPSNGDENPNLGSPQQWTIGASAGGPYRVYSHPVGGNTHSVVAGLMSSGVPHWVEGSLSPVSSCASPEFMSAQRSQFQMQQPQQFQHSTGTIITPTTGSSMPLATPPNHQQLLQQQNEARENSRRGRPRSEALTSLMIEGSTSPSAIKCGFCNRVFPREKSLQAHLRTHTGERPYPCDYPGCNRAFTQSGQLKTHQRLHTGERPFMCSAPMCQQRFTHANRHCPDHPYDQLKRCDDVMVVAASEQNGEVLRWLDKYRMDKKDRTPTRKTPKRSPSMATAGGIPIEPNNQENQTEYLTSVTGFANSPSTPINPYKSRKGLMGVLDMNAGLGVSPIASKIKANPKQIKWTEPLSQEEDSADEDAPAQSTFNPKKRWLREAWQDDLARPLDSAADLPVVVTEAQQCTITIPEQHVTVAAPRYVNPNEMRPTVLMVASKDRTMPLHLDPSPQHQAQTQIFSHDLPEQLFDESETPSSYQQTSISSMHQSAPNNLANPPNRQWLGAMALMELASNEEANNTSTQSLRPQVCHIANLPKHFTQTVVEQSYTNL